MDAAYIDDKPRLTFGELCEALSDGALPARQEDSYYVFSRRDLRELAESRDLEQLLTSVLALQQATQYG